MTAAYEYEGTELDLFAHARNWKTYWSRTIAPWVRGDVLEVGAGIGTNTEWLVERASGRWTCLEPDPALLERARAIHASTPFATRCAYVAGTLATLDASARFDTLLYLDVLEHVEDDGAEMRRAAERLRPGGRVIVLAPAHQSLYSPFDRAIGHFRRYDRASLTAAARDASELALERMLYLDSAGLLASLANRVLLKQSSPSLAQIRTWDKALVPASRVLDVLTLRRLGKSIVGAWRRA